MKVEARYCDACGVRIAPDDLREGEAVETDESVFYCKDCKAKQDSKKEDGKAKTLPSRPSANKRITSSRRLIARRLASGRLARTKAKVPPALTSSGEDLRKDPLKPSERVEKTPDKKKLEDRARVRAKVDLEKKKGAAKEKPAEKADAEVAAKPKKKKKKAKKPEAAEKKSEKKSESKAEEKKPEEAPKAEEKKAEEAPKPSEEAPKAEVVAEKKPEEAKAPESADQKPSEAVSEAKAEEKVEAKAETVAEKKAEPEAEAKPEKAEKTEKAEKADAEVAEKPKKKKAKKAESEELDELEELEEESEEEPAKAKKSKDEDSKERKALAEKGEKAEKAEKGDKKKKSSAENKALPATDTKGKLKTGSRTRAQLGKRAGSKLAIEAALADPDELPKKPKLPLVPILAVGGLTIALVGVFVFSGGGNKPVPVVKRDPSEYLNDLRTFAQTQKDPEEIAARWEGVRDAVDDSAKGECDTEAQNVRARLEALAKSEFDSVSSKIDKALESHDFDAALKALTSFPGDLRATNLWVARGPSRTAELVRRRAAFVEGQALLDEAKKAIGADKGNTAALEGLYAAYPDEHRQTDEGKVIADEFARLISEATHAGIEESGKKASEERAKNDAANYTKQCEKRGRVVAESEGNFRLELDDKPGAALFEWQVRPDMMSGMTLGEAIKVQNGKLSIKNDSSEKVYIGKNKRDWSHFVVEFKIKVSKGTKAYFLGKVSGGERAGYSWDQLPITASAITDHRPHYFEGIPDDTTVTLQFRYIGKSWDVVVNGKDVFLLNCTSQNKVGGFGFMCERGSIEIESVKSKVLSRMTASGEEEE